MLWKDTALHIIRTCVLPLRPFVVASSARGVRSILKRRAVERLGKVRSAAQVHSKEFRDCVALQAQYVLDTFGKFPGTVPSIFLITYLQAHHLDLDFYDRFYKPGAYLNTHTKHMTCWHGSESG